MKQIDALNLMKLGKNIFLTGEAGSGKTYLLNKYIRYLKDNNVTVAVTASTGIAATHLYGTTIHSWSGIGVKDSLTERDLEKCLESKRTKNNYKNTKVLIIDEISMLHKHQLDMVDAIAKYILKSVEPFGGMQVVLCGDFFQLPPVSSGFEEKQFAFEARSFHEAGFHVCYLHEQHRQGDDVLLKILNEIRTGTAGEQTKIPLRTRYKKEPVGATKPTKLYTRNVNVDFINEGELDKLNGAEKTFKMTFSGFPALVEGLKKSCLAPEGLKLKIGAEVMFVKNDPFGKYANGTRAVVVDFDKQGGFPVVKTYNKEMLTVQPAEWKFEDDGMVRATITQVPLRLAWAITIHKSQGMTLDAAEIDLGDAFEPGMGYVALSRVRSLNGLKLMNLNEMALKVHPRILEQDSIFKENSEEQVAHLASLPQNEILLTQNFTLTDRFKGNQIKSVAKVKTKKIPTHSVTLDLLKKNHSLQKIAEMRGLKTETILTHIMKLLFLKEIEMKDISYFQNTIDKTEFDNIFSELKKSEDGRITPIYEKFNGEYSYDKIKMVRLLMSEAITIHPGS